MLSQFFITFRMKADNMIRTLTRPLNGIVGGLPPIFWLIFVGTLINRVGSFVRPFLTLFLMEQGAFSAARASWTVVIYTFGLLIAHPIGGWMTDHFGRRVTLLCSFFGTTVFMLVFPILEHPIWIMMFVLPLGFFTDLYRPAMNTMIADVVRPEDRQRAYSLNYWVINFGFAVSGVLAGYVSGYDSRWLFWVDGLTSLAFGILIWYAIPESRPTSTTTKTPSTSTQPLKVIMGDHLFMVLVFLSFIGALIFQQMFTALPISMRLDGLSEQAYGLTSATNGIVIILLGFVFVRWVTGRSIVRMMALATMIIGAGFSLFAVANTAQVYILGMVITTIGEIIAQPVQSTFAVTLAPEEQRGLYVGIYGMSFGLGGFVSPLITTFILYVGDLNLLWWGCLGIGIIGAVGYLLIAEPLRRRGLA